MSYVFKQQFNINDLIPAKTEKPAVIILEPELYLARLAGSKLLSRGFLVHYLNETELLGDFLDKTAAWALLVNPGSYGDVESAAKHISKISQNFPSLVIVTIAHNTDSEDLRLLMSSGIASHINRKLSRPDDVAEIMHTFLSIN